LPFVLLLVLLLGVAVGRWRCVPFAVGVGSVIVQTHIAYAYALAALGAAALVLAAVRRGSLRGLPWQRVLTGRTARWSYAVFVVLWSQPIVEQLLGSGEGNLSRLASGASGGGLKIGVGDATRLTAAVLLQAPWQLRSGFTTAVPRTPLTATAAGPTLVISGIHGVAVAAAIVVVVLGALVALAFVHRHDGDALLATACWLAAAGVAAGVLCVAVVTVGPVGLGQHHVRWLWPMTILVQTVGGWAVLALVARRLRAAGRLPAVAPLVAGTLVAAAVVVFAVVALPADAQPEGPTADRDAMPALRQVFGQLDVLATSSPLLFDLSNLVPFEPYSSAVMMRLQELGIEFRVSDPAMVRQLGNRRRATGRERTSIFQLEGLDAVLYDGSACRVASASALGAAATSAAAAGAAALAGRLAAGQLAVDADRLPPDDRVRYETATAGGVGPGGASLGPAAAASASRLVDDGTVARWVADGSARLSDDDRATLGLVGRWVSTAYALFANDPATCPSAAPA
ncbi:MAG: hypothetical protein JWM12_2177, partial [Ilumatobacteraceae bacterium]|nr:hypothetical protein [Ilumatobacteraceae bacterium]